MVINNFAGIAGIFCACWVFEVIGPAVLIATTLRRSVLNHWYMRAICRRCL